MPPWPKPAILLLVEEHKSFIERLLNELKVFEVKRVVHAELVMIIAMAKGKIKHTIPYIGVSKLSCMVCSHYIHAFNEVANQEIATRGSHWKAYPEWFWPILPVLDGELRTALLRRIRQQIVSDFEHHAETWGRLSDSSAGSGGPEWEGEITRDDVSKRINAYKASIKEKKQVTRKGKKRATCLGSTAM
jgi:hypothetical protein